MSKKHDLPDDDLDDNLDIPDFDMDGLDSIDGSDRSPVESFGRGFLSGVGNTATSRSFQRNLINSALPDGYGDAFDAATTTVDTAKELYDTVGETLAPAKSSAKKLGRRFLNRVEGKLPKGIEDRLRDLTEEDKSTEASSFGSPEDNEISSTLASIFEAQETRHAEEREESDQKEFKQKALDDAKHLSTSKQIQAIQEGIGRLVSYQDKVASGYQRKSLELQFRQYFLQREQHNLFTAYSKDVSNLLKAISQNTSLPDFVKLQNSERFKEEMRNRLIGAPVEKVSNFAKNFGSQFRKNIKGRVKNASQSFTDGIVGTEDALSMVNDAGINKTEMAGNAVGSMALDGFSRDIGRFIGKRLDKRPELRDRIARRGADLGYTIDNLPEVIRQQVEDRRKAAEEAALDSEDSIFEIDEETGEFTEKKNVSMMDRLRNVRGSVTTGALGLLSESLGGYSAGHTFGRNISEMADEVSPYTTLADRSITEVIPNLLSEILRETEAIRTGQSDVSNQVYDFNQGRLVRKEESDHTAYESILPTKSVEAVNDNVETIVKFIDKDDVLSEEANEALRKRIVSDILTNRGVDLNRYTSEGTIGSISTPEIEEEVRQTIINNHFTEDGKLNDTLDTRVGLRKAQKNFRRAQDNLPDYKNLAANAAKVYGSSTLVDLGLADRKEHGRYELNMDNIVDRFIGRDRPTRPTNPPTSPVPQDPMAPSSSDTTPQSIRDVEPESSTLGSKERLPRMGRRYQKPQVDIIGDPIDQPVSLNWDHYYTEPQPTQQYRQSPWDNIQTGIPQWLRDQNEDIDSIAEEMESGESSKPYSIKGMVPSFNSVGIMDKTTSLFNEGKERASSIFDYLKNKSAGMASTVSERSSDLYDRTRSYMDDQAERMPERTERVKDRLSQVGMSAKDTASDTFDRLNQVGMSAKDMTSDTFDRLKDRIGTSPQQPSPDIEARASSVKDQVNQRFATEFNDDLIQQRFAEMDKEFETLIASLGEDKTESPLKDKLSTSLNKMKDGLSGKLDALRHGRLRDDIASAPDERSQGLLSRLMRREMADQRRAGPLSFGDRQYQVFNRSFLQNIKERGSNKIKSFKDPVGAAMDRVGTKTRDSIANLGSKAAQFGRDVKDFTLPENMEAIHDLYVKGHNKAAIEINKLGQGEYFDARSGMEITSLDDIMGAVTDRFSNIVISDKDLNSGRVIDGGGESKLTDLKDKLKGLSKLPENIRDSLYRDNTAGGRLSKARDSIHNFVTRMKRKQNPREVPQITDVYLDGIGKPVMLAKDLIRGLYVDAKTNEPIYTLEDIKGDVLGPDGQIVISEEDIHNDRLTDRRGKTLKDRLRKVLMSPLKGLGWLGKQYLRASKAYYKGLFNVSRNLAGRGLQTLGRMGLRLVGLNKDKPMDVYVKGESTPRLRAVVMKNGGYALKDSQKVIKNPLDITGEVIDMNGHVVISKEDIEKGLETARGRKIDVEIKETSRFSQAMSFPRRMINRLRGRFQEGDVPSSQPNETEVKEDQRQSDEDDVKEEQHRKQVEKTSDRRDELLKKMVGILDDRLEKPVAGDKSGDGFRDGSWRAQMAERNKANESGQVPSQGIASAAAATSDRRWGGEDNSDDGTSNSLLKSGAAGAAGAWIAGKARSAGRAVARGAGRAIRGGGRMLGRGLLGAGRFLGSTAVRGVAVKGAVLAGKALLGAGAALGTVISTPVVLTGLAIAAIGTGLFLLYRRYVRNRLDDVTKVRLAQYGFSKESHEDDMARALTLEKYLQDHVNVSGEVASIDSDIDIIEMLDEVGIDSDDDEVVEKFSPWFTERFKPIYLKYMAAADRLNHTDELKDLARNLDDEDKVSLLSGTKHPWEGDTPYVIAQPPFEDTAELLNSSQVRGIYRKVVDELKGEDKPNVSSPGEEVDTSTDVGLSQNRNPTIQRKIDRARRRVEETRDRQASVDSDSTSIADVATPTNVGLSQNRNPAMQRRIERARRRVQATRDRQASTYPDSTSIADVATAGSSAINLDRTSDVTLPPADTSNPLTRVRLKAYGLNDTSDDHKVSTLLGLERQVARAMRVEDDDVVFNENPMQYFGEFAQHFNQDPTDQAAGTAWSVWFKNRFLPVLGEALKELKNQSGQSDVSTLMSTESDRAIAVARSLRMARDKNGETNWLVDVSPWSDYTLNTSSDTIMPDLVQLQHQSRRSRSGEAIEPTRRPMGDRNIAPPEPTETIEVPEPSSRENTVATQISRDVMSSNRPRERQVIEQDTRSEVTRQRSSQQQHQISAQHHTLMSKSVENTNRMANVLNDSYHVQRDIKRILEDMSKILHEKKEEGQIAPSSADVPAVPNSTRQENTQPSLGPDVLVRMDR